MYINTWEVGQEEGVYRAFSLALSLVTLVEVNIGLIRIIENTVLGFGKWGFRPQTPFTRVQVDL